MTAFLLSTVPGFSDVPEAAFEAEKLALGIQIAKISDNAAFGMVRCEVFSAHYHDADTVILPTSVVDGYNYSREELTYVWAISNTFNAGSGWLSGPDSLWYAAWKVDQITGLVSCEEWYRRSGDHINSNRSTDGDLMVFTLAQRGQGSLTMNAEAEFIENDVALYGTDKPLRTDIMTNLCKSSKFAVVNFEAIYMGEFVNGDTVPAPISPVDGFTYDIAAGDVSFVFSWRWTALGSRYTQPDLALGQLGPMHASIDPSNGAVSASVGYIGGLGDGALTTETTHGRLAVVAICQRLGSLTDTGDAYRAEVTFSLPPSSGIEMTTLTGLFDSQSVVSVYYEQDGSATDPTTLQVVWRDSGSSVLRTDTVPINRVTFLVAPASADSIWWKGRSDPTIVARTETKLFERSSLSFSSVADDFAEIDLLTWMPGSSDRSSIMLQLDENIHEASASPEFFGPTEYANGSTVTLPVSIVDGYTYTRAECVYLWEWSKTDNQTGSHLRVPALWGEVNAVSGDVTLKPYRLPPGGPVVLDNQSVARVMVTVIASRMSSNPAVSGGTPNPPSDESSQSVDTNLEGLAVKVNGGAVSDDYQNYVNTDLTIAYPGGFGIFVNGA